MKKLILGIGIVILLCGGYFAWIKGWHEVVLAFLGLVAGGLFGSSSKAKRDLEQKKKEVDTITRELAKEKLKLQIERAMHDKEVKEVDEKDYSDMSIDDLLASANARERRRKSDKTD